MQIREIMSSRLDIATPEQPLVQAAKKMREDDIGSLPVIDSETVIGIITDRDIVVRCVAEGADIRSAKVRDAMSTDVVCCFEDQSVEEAARCMADSKIRRIPVLDAGKHLVGMVSLGDLSRQEPASESGDALREISEPTRKSRDV